MASAALPGGLGRAFGNQSGILGVLDVDHAEMARAPEQALRRLGVLDRNDAIGDLDQRAREMRGSTREAEKASARYSRVRLR
jgi:hypothetical protein